MVKFIAGILCFLFLSCKKQKNQEEIKSNADIVAGTYKAHGHRWFRTDNCNCYYHFGQVIKKDSFNVLVAKINDTTVKLTATSISGTSETFNIEDVRLRKKDDVINFYVTSPGNGFYSKTHNGGQFEIATSGFYANFDLSFRTSNSTCLTICTFHPVNNNDSTVAMQNINMIELTAKRK